LTDAAAHACILTSRKGTRDLAKQATATKRSAPATGKLTTPRSKTGMHGTSARQKRPASALQHPTQDDTRKRRTDKAAASTRQPARSAAKPAATNKTDLRAQLEKLERTNAKLRAATKEHGRTVKDLESQVEQLRRELEAARATEAAAGKALDRLKARDKARRAEEKAARKGESSDTLATPDDDVEDGSGGAGGVEGVRKEDERESAGVE
jgi:septal ring factor EnvC (AmiA/AmiB activator)